jgi:DNA-binding NarL/FixJ family response regulator
MTNSAQRGEALQEEVTLPTEMFQRFLSTNQKTQRPAETLTAREKMIVARVALGLSNAEIAGDLKISTQTVKNHLGSIFGKVGVFSRLELAAWLFKNDCNLCPFRGSSPPQRQGQAANPRGLIRSIPADVGSN